MSDPPSFLPGVPVEHVLGRLEEAGGKEIESGKFASPESSAALAVNCFGWFIGGPAMLPPFPGLERIDWPAVEVDVEYCARFPWSGGRHPWLDAVVRTDRCLIGVESKRFEPFRDAKTANFSQAYDKPCWGKRMGSFERLRDELKSGAVRFEHLDAAQLVKHAFGLVTQAQREQRRPHLAYVFAEPSHRGATPIDPAALSRHRNEITLFSSMVEGADVGFLAFSYRDWLRTWSGEELRIHRESLQRTFAP